MRPGPRRRGRKGIIRAAHALGGGRARPRASPCLRRDACRPPPGMRHGGPKCAPLSGGGCGQGVVDSARGVKAGPPVAPRPGRASLATRRAAAAAPPAPREGCATIGTPPRAAAARGSPAPRGPCPRAGRARPRASSCLRRDACRPPPGLRHGGPKCAPLWGADAGGDPSARPGREGGASGGSSPGARPAAAPPAPREGCATIGTPPRAAAARGSSAPRARAPLRPRPHRRWCARPRRRRPRHAGCGAP